VERRRRIIVERLRAVCYRRDATAPHVGVLLIVLLVVVIVKLIQK